MWMGTTEAAARCPEPDVAPTVAPAAGHDYEKHPIPLPLHRRSGRSCTVRACPRDQGKQFATVRRRIDRSATVAPSVAPKIAR